MGNMLDYALGALAPILIGGLVVLVRRIVKIQTPGSRRIEQLAPAVNALLDIQLPQTEALIALLEVQKGICNGNVDRALDATREAQGKFKKFLQDSAKVEEG